MTAMRSESVSASSWSWVTNTKVMPTCCWSWRSSICICSLSFLSSRPQGLVQQQHLRLLDERPRQRDPLALAAGQLHRGALAIAGQPDQLQHLPRCEPRARASGARTYACRTRCSRRRSDGGRSRSSGTPCSPDGDSAGTIVTSLPSMWMLPRVGTSKPASIPEQGRLPAPRGTQKREELSLLDLEVRVVDGANRSEVLEHVTDGDDRSRHLLGPPVRSWKS